MTTYCDVNTCEDCPRYGDDCDGDKRVEHTDLISRADAIEAVKDTILKRFNLADWYEEMLNCGVEIEDRIKALPSTEAEWIPCSERLPSDDEYVIVSVLDDHGDTPWKYTTVAWLCNGVWISDNEILCGTAVAWQPLPKPYKGGAK